MDPQQVRRARLRHWLKTNPRPEREKSYFSQLLSGKAAFGEKAARRIERDYQMGRFYLDQPVGLAEEVGEYRVAGRVEGAEAARYGVTSAMRLCPLISWVQAGSWSEVIDNLQPGDAEEWFSCPTRCGPHTYVLRVTGVSMEPVFRDGELIFVDPEAEARHGSFVVVRLDHEKTATFKQLVVERGRRYLRPLNDRWPDPIIEVEGAATICGVVVFKGTVL
jgi:SOS-response transcriptional repressor LexA